MEAPPSWNTSLKPVVTVTPPSQPSNIQETLNQFLEVTNQIFKRLDQLDTRLGRFENRMGNLEAAQSRLSDHIFRQMPPSQEISAPPAAILPPLASIIPKQAIPDPVVGQKRPSDENPTETPQPLLKRQLQVIDDIKEISYLELRIEHQRNQETTKKYLAETIDSSQVHVINKSTKIFNHSGKLLVIFMHNVPNLHTPEHSQLLTRVSSTPVVKNTNSKFRGAAAGKFVPKGKNLEDFHVNESGINAAPKTKPDPSKESKPKKSFSAGNGHNSISLGYLSHTHKTFKNPCRYVNKNTEADFDSLIPFLNKIASIYEKAAPEHHKLQMAALENHRQLAQQNAVFHGQIHGTPFTTLTINQTKDGKPTTHFHVDSNVVSESFVCLFVNGENYEGGETAFPELPHPDNGKPIAFNVRPGDLLLFSGSELLHGNTPVRLSLQGKRVSFVAYAQKVLAECQDHRCGITTNKDEELMEGGKI